MADAAVVGKLHMLPPQALPSEASVAEWMSTYSKGAPRWNVGAATHLPAGIITNIVMADWLRDIIAATPKSSSPCELATSNTDDDVHDAYFHVSRVVVAPLLSFCGWCCPLV